MPRLSRWLARTALLYLVAALSVGAALVVRPRAPWLGGAWPVYLHLLTVGWITQLIAAVAYWMFPRPDPRAPASDRGGWVFYVLLNTGLLLRAYAEPLPGARAILPFAAMLQLAAILVFVAGIWPRIRGR
ncbi:MAG TPA: hypothetical protein VF037_09000 [Gemmatimonadales bacterium]